MDADKREFLIHWAHDNGCVFEEEGEIGFGRECVGMTRDGSYVEYPYEGFPEPVEVEDAYHKGPYLAVLGRGEDALNQLYVWVEAIHAAGWTVEVEMRQYDGRAPSAIELLIHGATNAVFVQDPSRITS